MKIDFGSHFTKLSMSCLLLAGYAAPAAAQFKLQQDFKGTTASATFTVGASGFITASA